MSVESKNIGECPDCGGDVRFKKTPYIGQIITCRQCNTMLEVISRFPVELDWADEQWEEDEEIEEYDDYEPSDSDRHNKERW